MNKKFLVIAIILLFLIISAEGFLYWRMTRISPTPSVVISPGEYVTFQNVDVFDSPNQRTPFGYLVAGKHFEVLEQRGDWLLIENQQSNKAWIKASETAYTIHQPAQGD